MDVALKSEIILVVLEREEGVTVQEFSGLFHQVHGYQLSLKNYGYKSLKALLEDMKDEVELKNVNGQELIKYRPPPQHSVISPCMDVSCQKDDPHMLDMSSVCCSCCSQSGDIALDEFPKMQPSRKRKIKKNAQGISGHKSSSPALQSNSQFGGYLTSDVDFTLDTCFTEMPTPSNEIVEIISQKLKLHPTGLRAAKLQEHILEQHKIDLEMYSKTLGYTDMLSMLKEIPTIKFLNTSGKNTIIASCFYSNLVKDQHALSAKAELPKTGPSTLRSAALTQHSAQPDVSSNQKMANKEPLLNEASPSQGKPPRILETCTESLHGPGSKADDLLKMRVNHTQKSSLHEAPTLTLLVDNHSGHSKQKSLNTTHKENLDIVKIISETVISHHFGLKAKTLKQYMMSKYQIDLEVYSKNQGYTDMLSMLEQIPGIRFADDSKSNLLIPLVSHDKPHNSQPGQRKKDWNNIADVLRRFPSGLRVEKLKQHVLNIYHIDIEALSRELGYTDMLSMLKEVPGITTLNDDLFFASDIHKPKAKTAKKVNFSEKGMVDFLKSFSSGLTVKNLIRHMKKKNNVDLIKYSQEKGFTDVVCWLQTIPGIKVLNKSLVIASDVNKMYNSISKTKPAATKNLNVAKKTPQGSQNVLRPSTTRSTATGQQTPLPTFQIPLTNAVNNIHLNVQQGLRPDVSYASACAGNLGRNQINVQSQQSPPIFNVQKAHTAKATHPNYKEAPKAAMPSSKIKDNLQLLLKSHANGLSIFQLKKLYLLKFQQPLVPKGSSARKFLMGMKDVAKIKGVGVQMKVIPVLSVHPSASSNTHRDSTPQEAAAMEVNDGGNNEVLTHLQASRPLSLLRRTEQINHSIPVPLNSNQPFSLGCNQTESSGSFIPVSTAENINHKQHLYHNHGQQMAEIGDQKMVTTSISNQANSSGVLSAQFSKTHEPPSTAGFAGILNDAQWPSLPQKFNILKEITQGTKVPEQLQKNVKCKTQEKVNIAQTLLQGQQDPLKANGKNDHKQEDQTPEMHENISNNKSFLKNNPTVTSKPQRKDNIVQTLLQGPHDPFKANGKTDHKQKDPTSEKHKNIPNNNVSFKQNPTLTSKPQQKVNIVQTLSQGPQDPFKTNGKSDHKRKGQTSDLVLDFSFVMEEAGFSFVKEEKSANKDETSIEMESTHTTPLQLNQPAYSNMTAPNKGNAPEGNRRPANVLTQQKNIIFSSKNVTKQTNNDLVTPGTVSSLCSMPNQKSTDSQSQKQKTSVFNKHVDPLELKRQQALLQSQGIQPSCTGGQMASMPSKEQLENSSSKGICDFEQRESISMPPKKKVTESKSTKKVPNSKNITKVGAQHIPTEKSTSLIQTTSINEPKSSPASHVQQNLPGNPPVNAKDLPISHKLHKDNSLNIANGQILKQEHSQTKEGTDGTKCPLSSAQQKASTGHVYEHEQTVTGPFQTHAKEPHSHPRLPVKPSQSLTRIPGYYNGTAERPLSFGVSYISKPCQQLPLELKSQLGLLQSQGMQPSCTGGQMASMPSKEKQENSSSKGICDFEHREHISMPPKQEVTESKSTKKDPNSKTITKVGARPIPTEKSTSVTQTTSINEPKSSTVSHVQQNLPGNPPLNAKDSPISHKLHKDISLNIANGQILKQEHSQTKDGADGTQSPLSSAQQKASTDQVYKHEQTVTGPFQIHAKEPHSHTRLPVEQSQSLTRIPAYYHGTAERPLSFGRSYISKPYQHLPTFPYSDITSRPEFPNVPSDQEDNSSEESTKTWQTDSEHMCSIL